MLTIALCQGDFCLESSKALAIARLISVEQSATKSHASCYRVHLGREAGIQRYWEVPAAWRQALRGSEAPMLLNLLDEEDRNPFEPWQRFAVLPCTA